MTLRDDINAALKEAGISNFHFVRSTAYEELLNRIAEHFLLRGPADLEHIWLWERFREPMLSHHPNDAIQYLENRLPRDRSYWFLASEENGKYWVADTTGADLLRTLKGTYCFEYYIVERKLGWILCENHHGVLIQTGAGGILEAEPCGAVNDLPAAPPDHH
jgi:hypothetical protein